MIEVVGYCESVRNVTVSLDDETYRRARVKAAERDTSLSALVRDFLISLGEEETDFEKRKRLQDEVLRSIVVFRANDRLSRDEAHDRRALR
jgi:plasmid stability protein